MTPFATAISDYVANIKTAAEGPVTQASVKTFNAAVENFIGIVPSKADAIRDYNSRVSAAERNNRAVFVPSWSEPAPAGDTNVLTGAGADWGVSDRAQLWADVAQVEDDYRNLKVDGREG